MPVNSCLRSLEEHLSYERSKKRFLNYVVDRTAADGTRRVSVNQYDDVLKWTTYVSDYTFNPARDKIVYKNGIGWPASYFE